MSRVGWHVIVEVSQSSDIPLSATPSLCATDKLNHNWTNFRLHMSLVWLLPFFSLCHNWSCENISAGILFPVHQSDITWQNYRIQMKIIEEKYFLIDNQQPTSPICNLKSNSLYFVLLLLLFFLHLLLSLFASKKSPSFCLWIRAKKSPFSKTSLLQMCKNKNKL